MRRRPMLLLGISVVLILLIVYCSPLPLKFTSRDLRLAMENYAVPEHAVLCGILKSKSGEGDSPVLTLKEVTLEGREGALSIGNVRVLPGDPSVMEKVSIGWVLRAEGDLGVIDGPANPGEFDRAAYYRVQGISFQMRGAAIGVLKESTDPLMDTLYRWRTRVKMKIRELFPSDVSGLIEGMLAGDRSGIDDEVRDLWQSGGVTHMLAISGLHLSLIGMGIFHLLRIIGLPLIPSGVTASALMVVCTLFVGCPISAVRALIMFLVMMGAKLVGRTYDPATALAAAAVLVLVTNPEYLLYSAFQMSCCAVLLVTVFRRRSRASLALLLYLWMLPLVAWSCFEIPLLAVPVNLLAVPLLPVILGGGICALASGAATGGLPSAGVLSAGLPSAGVLSTGFSSAGTLITGFPAGIPCAAHLADVLENPFRMVTTAVIRGINHLLAWVNHLSGSVYPSGRPGAWQILLYLVLIFIWTWYFEKWRLFLRRFLLLLFVPVLIFILGFHPRNQLKVTFLSVGQGDGIVMELPSGHTVLVDGGSSSRREVGKYTILPFLKYEGLGAVDYMVATHMDGDHINGLMELLEAQAGGRGRMRIGTLLLPGLKDRDETYLAMEELAGRAHVRVVRVRAGDSFQIGEAAFFVLCPDTETETVPVNTNAQCVVLQVKYRDFDALFTGDVEGAGEEALIRSLKRNSGTYAPAFELLKVAHHGSRFSTPEELLDLLHPAVSVISCGAGNRYGHPHAELLERLSASGTAVFRTDTCGAVTVMTDGHRFAVETFRQP